MPRRPSTRSRTDRKSTRLNSSHTVIYTLSLHDSLPISGRTQQINFFPLGGVLTLVDLPGYGYAKAAKHKIADRSEEHTSELQSHSDLHSFPTRLSSDLGADAADQFLPSRWRADPGRSARLRLCQGGQAQDRG